MRSQNDYQRIRTKAKCKIEGNLQEVALFLFPLYAIISL